MYSIVVKFFEHLNIIEKIRKMNTISYKGVPLKTVYRDSSEWDLDHLPPIHNKREHIVLFKVPIAASPARPPDPHNCEVKWDSNHVKLPYSPQNEYKTDSESDPTKTIQTTRWDIIQTALLRDIQSSQELEAAILTYNPKYAKVWKFTSLHELFEEELDKSDAEMFFKHTLPPIIRLALQLPQIVPCSIPLLKRGQNKAISLSQKQIACLLANAFLCTFPRRNDESRHSEYFSYPSINFCGLFLTPGDQTLEKLKCICNYFRRVTSKMPTGVVTFARRSIDETQLPDWDKCEDTFADSLLHVSSKGTIEDDGNGLLQVDFANKYLGGGVLSYGCVQEEIRFMINPELLCSRLFTEVLQNNECLTIVGCEQFSEYKGYASTFAWMGNYQDKTPIDSFRRRKCAIVAIDAICFYNKYSQFKENMIRRELNKAYVGFKHDLDTLAPGIATGNWGCGAFNGDKHLKSLIQLMACCVTKRPLVYYTFGDEHLRDDLFTIYEFLSENKVKIAELWSCLLNYAKKRNAREDLYDFVIRSLQQTDEPKPSTNGQSSKPVNRSNVKDSPSTTPPTSDCQENSDVFMDDLASKQFNIENPDDDDFYLDEETLEWIKSLEKSTKPKFTSAKTISNFFEKPSNTTENQDMRPRSLLLEGLDKVYNEKKSPAKIKQNSTSPESAAVVNSISNPKHNEEETEKVPTMLIDESETGNIESQDESVYNTVSEDGTFSEDEKRTESSVLSEEDQFEDAKSGDEKMGSDHNINVSKSDNASKLDISMKRKKTNDKSSKTINRQSIMFENYFIKNNCSSTSTSIDIQSTSTSKEIQEGSLDTVTKTDNYSEELPKMDSSIADDDSGEKSSTTPQEIEHIDMDLLTNDESVHMETGQLKSLHVETDNSFGDPMSQDIEFDQSFIESTSQKD